MVHYFLYWLDIQVECSKYSKNTVKIWNPTQGSLILTLIGHTNSINKLTALTSKSSVFSMTIGQKLFFLSFYNPPYLNGN